MLSRVRKILARRSPAMEKRFYKWLQFISLQKWPPLFFLLLFFLFSVLISFAAAACDSCDESGFASYAENIPGSDSVKDSVRPDTAGAICSGEASSRPQVMRLQRTSRDLRGSLVRRLTAVFAIFFLLPIHISDTRFITSSVPVPLKKWFRHIFPVRAGPSVC